MLSVLFFITSLIFSQFGILFGVLLFTLYYFITKDHDYFEKRGIRYEKPDFLFGNQKKAVTKKYNFMESYQEIYRKHSDVGIVGIFELLKPTFMIRDTELLKQITIKDFDSFVNHRTKINPESDPAFAKGLFGSSDQIWRELRTVLSPAFTGSKMRFLFDLVRQCAERTTKTVEENLKNGEYQFEAKDFFSRITNDTISTSAFGIETNSLVDKDNEVYRNRKQFTDFDLILSLKFFLYASFPGVMNFFKIRVLDKVSATKLRDIVLEAVTMREKSNLSRPDMIQLLIQARRKGRVESKDGKSDLSAAEILDDDYLAAQCLIFFLAGFDTVSQLFTFMNYELALNPDVQEKLQSEIDELLSEIQNEPPTYDQINKLKYLDMVIQESLRKWPPVIFIDRSCNKPVTLQDFAGQKVTLQPGDHIVSPTCCFHFDPKYFPNPDKFDPERFSDENKDSINQFAYQPFGLGPRQCIGNRFALMEAKVVMFYLLSKFNVVRNANTEVPVQIERGAIQYNAVNGVHLSFKLRT